MKAKSDDALLKDANEAAPLARIEAGAIERPHNAPTEFMGLINEIVKAPGSPDQKAGALKIMQDCYEHAEDRSAKRAWITAYSRLQAELEPAIKHQSYAIQGRTISYSNHNDYMATLDPLLPKHGFTLFLSMEPGPGEGMVTCVLEVQHTEGHVQTSRGAARIGRDLGGDAGKAYISACTTAQKHCIARAFNIVTREMGEDNAAAVQPPQHFTEQEVQGLDQLLNDLLDLAPDATAKIAYKRKIFVGLTGIKDNPPLTWDQVRVSFQDATELIKSATQRALERPKGGAA